MPLKTIVMYPKKSKQKKKPKYNSQPFLLKLDKKIIKIDNLAKKIKKSYNRLNKNLKIELDHLLSNWSKFKKEYSSNPTSFFSEDDYKLLDRVYNDFRFFEKVINKYKIYDTLDKKAKFLDS